MKNVLAFFMALAMTFQLAMPAWADAVEEGPEESTEAVEETCVFNQPGKTEEPRHLRRG